MDPLTHITLGVATALVVAPRTPHSAVVLAGVAGALLPDADIFIRSATDPLLGLEFHRHFTHSLLFQPVIAVLAATIAWLLTRCRSRWIYLLLPGLAAGVSHIVCDAWTSYGTRLWWPFSNQRVAWDMIAIIDPLVTVPMLLAVSFALWKRSSRTLPAGFVYLAAYLGLAMLQHHRAITAVQAYAAASGHAVERVTAKPSLANIIVWRGLYQADGQFHAVAVRPGLFRISVLPGAALPVYNDSTAPIIPPASRVAGDLARFRHFSDNWVAEVASLVDGLRVVGDVRYALLPQRMAPLWGIAIDLRQPDNRAAWMSFRRANSGDAVALWHLVTGADFAQSTTSATR